MRLKVLTNALRWCILTSVARDKTFGGERVRVNINKLNGKIVEKQFTKDGIAAICGVNRSTFYRRLKNNSLKLADVHAICAALGLTAQEAMEIFLSE